MLGINCHIFGYLYFSPNTFPKILQKTWWPLINSFKCIRERRERCQGFVLTSLLPLSHLLNFCKSLYELQPYSIMFKVVFFSIFQKVKAGVNGDIWANVDHHVGMGMGIGIGIESVSTLVMANRVKVVHMSMAGVGSVHALVVILFYYIQC